MLMLLSNIIISIMLTLGYNVYTKDVTIINVNTDTCLCTGVDASGEAYNVYADELSVGDTVTFVFDDNGIIDNIYDDEVINIF